MAEEEDDPEPILERYRWTTAEYVLRCEQSSDLRELLVEGNLDRYVFADAFARWGGPDVNVITSDFIEVPQSDVIAAGFSGGTKGRLLVLAAALDEGRARAEEFASVGVVVDRDYDVPNEAMERVWLTDGNSMESYAFNIPTLDRFARFILGREGSESERRRGPRHGEITCTGGDLYVRVSSAATVVAAVRMLLGTLNDPVGLTSRWVDQVRVDANGQMAADGVRLLRNALATKGRTSDAAQLEEQMPSLVARVSEDPFRLVRGHDFVDILLRLLRSQWGSRVSRNRFRSEDPGAVARLLMLSVNPADLDRFSLFETVRAEFG